MAYNFQLPTTSALAFGRYIRCDSHPSLVLAATTHRTVLRSELKKHKRLPAASQATNLSNILAAINEYLPYLLALDHGLAGRLVNGEEVLVTLHTEVETEWRSSIASSPPGRQASRIKGKGLDYEILFVLSTAAYIQSLDARRQLSSVYVAGSSVTPEQRKLAVNGSMNSLLTVESLCSHALKVAESVPVSTLPAAALDVQPTTISALAALSFASATLLAVIKDDDYMSLAAQARDENDREWMYKAPNIPKVRAHLFARLCLSAADHAGRAHALFSARSGAGTAVREDLIKYAKDLQQTSRAKAYRFLGVDTELSGKLGDALGWLNAAKKQLGLPMSKISTDSKGKFKPSFAQLKKDWSERRERKGLEGKATPSLDDAGKVEEGRVLEMLDKNWNKTNDLINHHIVTDDAALLQSVPTGREVHSRRVWPEPSLQSEVLERLRALPERDEDAGDADDSGDEIEGEQLPGSFPTSAAAASSGSAYY